MSGGKIFAGLATAGLLTMGGFTVAVGGFLGQQTSASCYASPAILPTEVEFADTGSLSFKGEQLENAKVIIGVGRSLGMSERDVLIAVWVAIQESKLKNLDHGDLDSFGLFQQRPSQGYGSASQILDPVYASNKFYEALARVKNRDQMSPLDVALAVQRPSKAAYLDKDNYFPGWEDEARSLLASVGSGVSAPGPAIEQVAGHAETGVVPQAQPFSLSCISAGLGVAPDGFTFPVLADRDVILQGVMHGGNRAIWNHTAITNYHHDYMAADIHAPVGTTVVAAMGGKVVSVTDNGCGRGGKYDAPRITIEDESTGLHYYYTHMLPGSLLVSEGQQVSAGTPIGRIGPSGCAQGSAPHLHIHATMGPGGNTEDPAVRARMIDIQPMLVAAFNALGQPGGNGSVVFASNGVRVPVNNPQVTSSYGMRFHPIDKVWKLHNGIDFGAPTGTPVYAANAGVVTAAGPRGGYGNFVTIRHGDSTETGYAHLDSIAPGIIPGLSRVQAGQMIGRVGSTGKSTGPHLHFIVWVNGQAVDPADHLRGLL